MYRGDSMETERILQEIKNNMHAVIHEEQPLGTTLWQEFISLHPADIANFFSDIETENFQLLFERLPKELKIEVFKEFSDVTKLESLSFMTEHEKAEAINELPADELTDLFDLFSDEELKEYLNLLHKKARQQVLSLMKFHPESAGGIMETEVLSLRDDFTVEKGVKLLQRLQVSKDIYQQIFVTDHAHRLVGHINLVDLVLHRPNTRISTILKKNEFVARADEDREQIASKMVHYDLMTVPVVGDDNQFLGVIPTDTLIQVLVEEATEDLQKMSALAPLKYAYFETSFVRLFFERSYILISLLLAQSFAAIIMNSYAATMIPSLLYFTTMLIGAGGNSSTQTSAMVIQGLATGEIRGTNLFRFLKREFFMAGALASVLSIVGFTRAYLTTYSLWISLAISSSLFAIVFFAVTLGSLIPILLKRVNIDPAFSAGPFLATLMDILGTLIYCYVCQLILR